ncbi:MAG: GNAT family N-acetyltransferase [Actinobacteria bacterium]|nr:GNAT family N-acetyltransferase [Actinomycetota bacterium]
MAFVRAARPDDAETIAGIHLRAWRDRYRDWPESIWARLAPAVTSDTWRRSLVDTPSTHHLVLVATDDTDRICGFATLVPDDQDQDHTLIDLLEVDPPFRRTGHGSRLMSASAVHAEGQEGLLLWIDQGSDAGRFLVDSGWGPRGRRRILEVAPDMQLAQHQWWTSIGKP